MPEFYSLISETKLRELAEKAGLGEKVPRDLKKFAQFLKKGSKVLEVGCGTGRLGRHLIKGFDYTGIDDYKPFIEAFKQSLKKVQGINGKIIHCSFQDFKETGFDSILFPWSVIEDFKKEEQLAVIQKAKNMLNKEGVILLDNPSKDSECNVVPGPEPNEFYFEEWENKLRGIGFSRI